MHRFHVSKMASLLPSLALFFAYSPSPLQAGVFPQRPDVLVCSVEDTISAQPWEKFVFYVSGRLEDGGVLYKSLTSNPVLVTITADGRVEGKNLADCDGKTVAKLREEGRAFDFEASSPRP